MSILWRKYGAAAKCDFFNPINRSIVCSGGGARSYLLRIPPHTKKAMSVNVNNQRLQINNKETIADSGGIQFLAEYIHRNVLLILVLD
jgi:hypothetical protein